MLPCQLDVSPVRRACVAAAVALAACALPGCYGDDPDDPRFHVDFITFLDTGTYREFFVDTSFQAGELAFDVLGEDVHPSWRMGPWPDLVRAIDSDAAPYPNPMLPRKRTPHDGRLDKRYWVQFAGGNNWRSLAIEVDPISLMRASSSPPSIFPQTVFMWCPDARAGTAQPCITWQSAVMAREVRCWRLDPTTGKPSMVSALACLAYHPRTHWRIVTCDDCDPIPTATYESVAE